MEVFLKILLSLLSWWLSQYSADEQFSALGELTFLQHQILLVWSWIDFPLISSTVWSHSHWDTRSWLQLRNNHETCSEFVKKDWSKPYRVIRKYCPIAYSLSFFSLDYCFWARDRTARNRKNQENIFIRNKCYRPSSSI